MTFSFGNIQEIDVFSNRVAFLIAITLPVFAYKKTPAIGQRMILRRKRFL